MLTSERAERVRAEHINILFSNAPIGTTGAMLAGVLLAALVYLADATAATTVCVWIGILFIVFAAHIALCVAHWRRRPPPAGWRFWSRCFLAASLAEGVIWGGGSVAMMMASGGFERELTVMIVVAPVAACAIAAYGPYLPAFVSFMAPSMAPYMIYSVLMGDAAHWVTASLVALFLIATSAIAWRFNSALADILRLRFENAELVENLREQTRRAEAANVAKSRFLASASHDLRQPIHALGMFVGALRGRQMDEEGRRILGNVERSIAALDGLFSALLDISKIDAGVVEKRPRVFAIQPLLERIVGDHVAAAQAKGVGIRVAPCAAAVETDPILIERILRNIVTNAIRFTQRGRIVVGCRRRGARLRVDVIDTGPGVPPQETSRIFEEFHQLENPERDRAKGLGLGLAIVSRLARLLECAVEVESRVARGSRFSVYLPRSARQPLVAPMASVAPRVAEQGLVLVVDDEIMIQQGLAALLQEWGFTALTAGSGAEMLEKIADCRETPRLILCDFRLRGDENGIKVLRELQAQYEEEIAGLLITGDTAPERLRESVESGLMLLHKPVSPNRLKAAIDRLLAGAAPDAAFAEV
jgi:two-component system, sensor histidine kinase